MCSGGVGAGDVEGCGGIGAETVVCRVMLTDLTSNFCRNSVFKMEVSIVHDECRNQE